MVDIKNKKFGFSLAETLVSMLVLSMFFLATSKVITTKPKKEIQSNKHGYFECYRDRNGALMQKRSDGSYSGAPTQVVGSTCHFVPPSGIAFILIYALNNTDGLRFYVSQEPQMNTDAGNEEEITITSAELPIFHKEYMEDPGEGNQNLNELMNFFYASYPSSSIYENLEALQDPSGNGSTYSGPAVFIGW